MNKYTIGDVVLVNGISGVMIVRNVLKGFNRDTKSATYQYELVSFLDTLHTVTEEELSECKSHCVPLIRIAKEVFNSHLSDDIRPPSKLNLATLISNLSDTELKRNISCIKELSKYNPDLCNLFASEYLNRNSLNLSKMFT